MDLQLPSIATQCFVSGIAFVEDERVVSRLIRQDEDGDIVRVDVQIAADENLELPPGRVACRWIQLFKPRVAEENPEKDLKLTAENLFLTMAAPDNELGEEDGRLVQFLALMLERKRLLKPRGKNVDGTKDIYVHRGSKGLYEVPVGELTPEFFIAVQDQLTVLVGAPEEPTGTAADAEPQVEKAVDQAQTEA